MVITVFLGMMVFLSNWAMGSHYPDVRLDIDFGELNSKTQDYWEEWSGDPELRGRDFRIFPEAFHFNPLEVSFYSFCGFNFVTRAADIESYYHALTMDSLCACHWMEMTLAGLPKGDYDIGFYSYDEFEEIDNTIKISQVLKDGRAIKKLDLQTRGRVPIGPINPPRLMFVSNGEDPIKLRFESRYPPIFLNAISITLFKEDPSGKGEDIDKMIAEKFSLIPNFGHNYAYQIEGIVPCYVPGDEDHFFGYWNKELKQCVFNRSGERVATESFQFIYKTNRLTWKSTNTSSVVVMETRSRTNRIKACIVRLDGGLAIGYKALSGSACRFVDPALGNPAESVRFEVLHYL